MLPSRIAAPTPAAQAPLLALARSTRQRRALKGSGIDFALAVLQAGEAKPRVGPFAISAAA